MIYIYELKCMKTGFKYIGSTKSLYTRKSKHKSDLMKGLHHSAKMQKQFKKHGWDNFAFEILETCNDSNRDERENYWIKQVSINKSFNTSYAGESPGVAFYRKNGCYTRSGAIMSDETKRKISKANTGKKKTPEARKKMSEKKLGKKPWNAGKKGIMKPNSGSFGNGRTAPLKGRKRVIIDGKVRFILPEDI